MPPRYADVIVLHRDRAKMSRIDLLGELPRLGLDVPIVLLTGEQASPQHECPALDEGAIDVIGKSRGSGVLAKRLKGAGPDFLAYGPTARAGGCTAEASQVVAQAQR